MSFALLLILQGAGLSLNDVMHILTQPYQEKKFDPRIYSCLSCSTLTCPDVKYASPVAEFLIFSGIMPTQKNTLRNNLQRVLKNGSPIPTRESR